jgi:hypothetical protein
VVFPSVSIGIPAGLGQCQLVVEEVHLVAGVVVIGARLKRTPGVLPEIAEIDLMAVVERHVHALVRKTLVWNVLVTERELEQMFCVTQRECRATGSRDLYWDEPTSLPASHSEVPTDGPAGLKLPPAIVVVGLRRRPA